MTNLRTAAYSALALAGLSFASTSFAGTGKAVTAPKEIKETIKESCITGDLGVVVVSEYISRGLVLEDQGAIAQPYLDLYFKLYEGDGFINKVQFNLGLWSSIHSHVQPDGSTDSVRNWYEFDYTAGIAVTMAKNFTATLSYFEFDSPANAFSTARSINLNIAYDDSEFMGPFALRPHVAVLRELNAPGFAGLGGNGWYFEVGIAPSYTFAKGGTYPVTLSAPINAGFGDDKFYDGDNFGFVSGGAQLSVPLSFIPECYGSWTFSGGYTYFHLGDRVAEVTAQGDEGRHVFQGAVGLAF